MALKAKNDEGDESSKDENSKFKSYILENSRMRMSRQMTRIANSLDSLNLSLKINSRKNLKKLDKVATL